MLPEPEVAEEPLEGTGTAPDNEITAEEEPEVAPRAFKKPAKPAAAEGPKGRGGGKGGKGAGGAAVGIGKAKGAGSAKEAAVNTYSKDFVSQYLKATSEKDPMPGRHCIHFSNLEWDLKREHGQPRLLKDELWTKYYRKLLIDGAPRTPFAEGLAWQKAGVVTFCKGIGMMPYLSQPTNM